MNWLRTITERIQNHYSDKRAREAAAAKWMVGYHAFERGNAHFLANRLQEALVCFDEAISCGVDDAAIYGNRGSCLQSLGYNLDAIDDFNKAIAPETNDCNLYYMRSISRSAIKDYDGCISDLQEAIRLSRVDSALNKSYADYAKEMGWQNMAAKFEFDLCSAKDDAEFYKRNCERQKQYPELFPEIKPPENLKRRMPNRNL